MYITYPHYELYESGNIKFGIHSNCDQYSLWQLLILIPYLSIYFRVRKDYDIFKWGLIKRLILSFEKRSYGRST